MCRYFFIVGITVASNMNGIVTLMVITAMLNSCMAEVSNHGLYGIFNVSLSARPPFFVEEETISVCRSHTPSGTCVWY